MHNEKIYEVISPWLDAVDKQFADAAIEVSQRPTRAGFWLVKNAITEIKGAKSDTFFDEEWFSVLMELVIHWYEEKYGTDLLKSEKDKLSGLVLFHELPLFFQMSTITSKVEVEGETSWLTFPDHLQADEETLDLFPVKPKLEKLNPDELKRFWELTREVVLLSRSANLYLKMLEGIDDLTKQMSDGIWGHFEKAIADIKTMEKSNTAVACWELHLAIEKAFKVFISQKSGKKHYGHDLEKLNVVAAKLGLQSIPELHSLPDHTKAIKFRYGEESVSVKEAFEFYLVALRIIYSIARGLDRKLKINNASFLLKKPKWV